MLSDLLTVDVINLNIQCDGWEEALQHGTNLLVENDYIQNEYVEAIIQNFKNLGPYMVVAPGIVLSHARPEDGVNQVCMSLITLRDAICFGHEDNDPVKLIITFAAIDNVSHLSALSQLMDLFMNNTDIEKIMKATKNREVLDIIHRYSK